MLMMANMFHKETQYTLEKNTTYILVNGNSSYAMHTNGGLGDVRGLPEGLFAYLHMTTHEGR